MSENEEKYAQAFCTVFEIGPDTLAGLKYQDIPAWDSVGHMALVAELENTFDIMMEPGDIIDLSSYERGKGLLSKYGIEF